MHWPRPMGKYPISGSWSSPTGSKMESLLDRSCSGGPWRGCRVGSATWMCVHLHQVYGWWTSGRSCLLQGARECLDLEASLLWRHQENQNDPMPGRHNREQKGTDLHLGRVCQALATCFPALWKMRLLASLWPCCSPSLPCFCSVAPCGPWKRCSTLSHHQAERHNPKI